jgi:hypothetical protein
MTHIRPSLGARSTLPPIIQGLSVPSTPLGLDPNHIRGAIAAKRSEIASLESDWAAASERAAARSLGGLGRLGDRETWDRATWNRYLSAAADGQDLYLPRLRRLYAEVERLERLQDPLPAGYRRVA